MTQGRDKGLDDKGRDKGMTQGYDARAALTGHMLRSLNWHAAIYIYGRCDFIMGDSTGRAHQKVVVKPGNPELIRAARFTFFACMI